MKLISTMAITFAAATALSCSSNTKEESAQAPLIEKNNITLKSDRMTPEALLSLGRVNSVTVSPNGKKILYAVSYTSIEQNKSNNELFVIDTDGNNKKQLTHTPFSENDPTWINNGKEIAFLSAESGSMQLWKMDAEGNNRICLSQIENGINGFKFSPDETKVLFTSDIKSAEKAVDLYADLPKATGRPIKDLMFKHWNEWVETVPHPFIASVKGNQLENIKDIMEGEPFESPMKPFGGMEQLAWSPDGKYIAYTSRKKTGMQYALSTNSDIYLYDVEKQTTQNLTEGMMGYDTNPKFSPDGKYIAWESMEHDGWESDKNRLFIYEIEKQTKKDLSTSIDFNIAAFSWTKDSHSIYFTGCWHAVTHIYQISIADEQVTQITQGYYDYLSVAEADDALIATRQSFSAPTDIYRINPKNGEAVNISEENKEILSQITMGKAEERWIETIDHKKMLVWVIYPPHFDPNKKYPALLYCQGGPQSTVSQFWSYRWNMQAFVANDYIMVAPNRRGVPGFGKEWLEEISGDYGGLCMQDYFSAIDALKQEPFIDEERLGCIGASFGGYSVYWLAGNHDKRFKTFVSHCGIFNFEQQYLETEEMFFVNRDLGGPYWEWNNEAIQKSYACSPHLFVDKWDTPLLVITGEKDFRILASQGMAAFSAAKLRGIPSEMLLFPDEGHWVLKPQNSILWHRTVFQWLNKWLK